MKILYRVGARECTRVLLARVHVTKFRSLAIGALKEKIAVKYVVARIQLLNVRAHLPLVRESEV